jgi:hypothetical protein
MRVFSSYELARLTKRELSGLPREILSQLPYLSEYSVELRNAYVNLENIRKALARPEFKPR